MRKGRFNLDSKYVKGVASFLFDIENISLVKVIGTSMEPTIMQGDIVTLERNYNELQVGDVVLFYNKNHFTTHRIIDITHDEEKKYYITRGDAVESSTEKINEEVIIGKIVMCEEKEDIMSKDKYILKEDMQLRMINQEGFIYDKKNEKIHIINSTAYEILEMLNEKKMTDEIVNALDEKYHVEKAVLLNDVCETIEQFEKLGIITKEKVLNENKL